MRQSARRTLLPIGKLFHVGAFFNFINLICALDCGHRVQFSRTARDGAFHDDDDVLRLDSVAQPYRHPLPILRDALVADIRRGVFRTTVVSQTESIKMSNMSRLPVEALTARAQDRQEVFE